MPNAPRRHGIRTRDQLPDDRGATFTAPPGVPDTVTANRSLDEFAAESRESPEAVSGTAEPAADPDEAPGEESDDPPELVEGAHSGGDGAGEPESVASTYVWTPGGGFCATCDEPVEERWRDGDDLVCGDCKEW